MDASERCRSVRYQTFEVFYELQNDSEYDNLCETFRGNYFLLFVPPMTAPFFAVYTICGLTDACDGFIARKLDAVTDFGSKLDSVSDITFYIVMISRVLPEYYSVLPHSYWYAVAAVLVVRLASYAVSAIKQHRFASVHTLLNKVTGAGVFFAHRTLSTAHSSPFMRSAYARLRHLRRRKSLSCT